jgi:Flp pilus assembly protein TadG
LFTSRAAVESSTSMCEKFRCARRRASVTLELIVALPLLIIGLLAVVEFGVLLASLQQVAAASYEGAKAAAEAPALTSVPADNVLLASNIRALVDRRLQSAGFGSSASQGVTLRHTVGGGGDATDGICADPLTPPLPTQSVRVTVCVELTRLAPNVLSSFGFTLTGKVAEFTTTLDYEN